MSLLHLARQRVALSRPSILHPALAVRCFRHQAFDAAFDQDALAEARSWRETFDASRLPVGNTTYSRSSGPGGQHVNKTESKATTVWPVRDLLAVLPSLLHGPIRVSKYYTANNDSWTIQAQVHRSRSANLEENRQKMTEEVERIYANTVPGETTDEKKDKHRKLEKASNETRVKAKKHHSSKKQFRKGGID